MTRQLILLRHGKAVADIGEGDRQRKLVDRGKRDAQRVGVWLHCEGLRPDHVVASPAVRAFATAEKACHAMDLDAGGMVLDGRIYNANVTALMTVVRDLPPAARRVLLVGHNPGLEGLLAALAGVRETLKPADLACLRLDSAWRGAAPGTAATERIMRAADLPAKFPFPSPDGAELRDRPAYYYVQSGVIPFRVEGGALEVLVANTAKKHCILPKGNRTPGLTPWDSAAREALEEAGARGRVWDRPLGAYARDKWGATCTVTLYPMEVSELLDEAAWPESHRGRAWLSPERAAARLKDEAGAALVLEFRDGWRAAHDDEAPTTPSAQFWRDYLATAG